MQSIKNTAVSIVLLFLSYGVYQVITKPLPSDNRGQATPIAELQIVEPDSSPDSATIAENLKLPPVQLDNDSSQDFSIPEKLLNSRLSQPQAQPNSLSSSPTTSQSSTPGISFDDPVNLGGDFSADNNQVFPVTQASSEEELQLLPSNNSNQDIQLVTNEKNESLVASTDARPFDADSSMIPSTVMGDVNARPKNSQLNDIANANPKARKKSIDEIWPQVSQWVQQSRYHRALEELSAFYHDDTLNEEQKNQLLDWLDALAGKVIYSSEHHLESQPYIVRQGDTIGSLARKWQIPAQLIYNVNLKKMPNPNLLKTGSEIKHIQGPFDAEIAPLEGTMTLFLGKLYAGRFEIQPSATQVPGEFRIVDKSAQDQLDRPYWMALSNGGSIFASNTAPTEQNELALNLREAEEVFSILSASSVIRVMR